MKALISFYKIIEILIQLYGHPSNLPYGHPSNLQYGHPSNLPYGHPSNLPVPATTYTKTYKCKQTVSVETSYLPPYTHTWPKFVCLERILILFTDCFQSYIRDTLDSISHLQSVIFNQSSSISDFSSSCSYHSHPTQIASSTHPIDLETIPVYMEIWRLWLKIFKRWILWFRNVTIHKF